ncbi:MAG: PilZ domain-containing protein [Acidobacteria bacterium]|nr:PilZ domain-containing protein [Acidobacteriota bacterium]
MPKEHSRSRAVERIQLGIPILAKVNAMDAVMLDFSLRGCRLESHLAFKVNMNVTVTFDWGGEHVNLKGRVVRCKLDSASGGTVFNTGIMFDAEATDTGKLRSIIARQLDRALEEQKANARGELAEILEHMPIFSVGGTLAANQKQMSEAYEGKNALLPWTRIARERGYVKCAFDGTRWRRVRTPDREQPEEGFTVWAYEDNEDLEKLQRVYEKADWETRTLIRLCAQLSLDIDDTLPPQRFRP